jgi:hypothetical protein
LFNEKVARVDADRERPCKAQDVRTAAIAPDAWPFLPAIDESNSRGLILRQSEITRPGTRARAPRSSPQRSCCGHLASHASPMIEEADGSQTREQANDGGGGENPCGHQKAAEAARWGRHRARVLRSRPSGLVAAAPYLIGRAGRVCHTSPSRARRVGRGYVESCRSVAS